MFNNTSSFEYYNYGNFDKKHAPPNVAYQPKKLIPELEQERESDKLHVSLVEKPNEEKKPEENKGLIDNLGDFGNKMASFFASPPVPEPANAPVIGNVPVPVPVPRNVPVPVPVPVPAPLPVPAPRNVSGLPTSPAPQVPQVQMGGGEYSMDMHSLMRKNRMLTARVQELEKDLYLSKRR
jgi:hypothetical protein